MPTVALVATAGMLVHARLACPALWARSERPMQLLGREREQVAAAVVVVVEMVE
jgi:hypothetical protein